MPYTTKRFLCDVCGKEADTYEKAVICEKTHKPLNKIETLKSVVDLLQSADSCRKMSCPTPRVNCRECGVGDMKIKRMQSYDAVKLIDKVLKELRK